MDPTTDNTAPPSRPRKRKWLRWALLSLLALIVLASVFAGYVYHLWTSVPAYWAPLDAQNATVQQTAQVIEQHVTTQTTRARPADDTWTLELTQEEANAWLASRAPKWLANQGVKPEVIDRLRRSMIVLRPGEVELAVQGLLPDSQQIISAVYTVSEMVDGAATMKLTALHAGRLPLPVDTVLDQVAAQDSRFDAEARAMIETLPLRIPLGDGREAVCEQIEIGEGMVTLTCRTVRIPQ